MKKTFLLTFLDLLEFSKQELQRIRMAWRNQQNYYNTKKQKCKDPEKLAEIERNEKEYFRKLEARQNALFAPNTYWNYRIIKFTPKAYLAIPTHLPHVHIRMTEEESQIFDKCVLKAGYFPVLYADADVAVLYNKDKTRIEGFRIREYKEASQWNK